MQFSPDSRTLAIARGSRDDNRVELWDTETGKLRRTIRGFDGPIWSVSFSPDGKTLVTGSGGMHPEKVAQKPNSRDGKPFTELKWWDPQTGDLKRRFELPDEELVSVAAVHSPNGRLLAAVENRLSLQLVSLDEVGPAPRGLLTQASPMLHSGVFDSDLRLLDAASGELLLKLKDGFTNSQFPALGRISRDDLSAFLPRQPSAPITFSPDGQLVAAWNANEVRLWSSSTGVEVLKIRKFKGRLSAIAFAPDGRTIAGAIVKFSLKDHHPDYKSEIQTWDAATGAPRQVVPLTTQSVSSLIFAGNGQQLLVGGLQGDGTHSFASMELADLQTGSLGKLIAKDEGTLSSICVSPDGATMAFQTDASTVKLLETQGWRTKFTLGDDDEASSSSTSLRRFLVTVNTTSAVAFLSDGKTVAGEIENGGIKIWDSRTGEVKKTLGQEAETGSIAAISANGSAIAEVAPDDSVRLWNLETGKHQIIPAAKSRVAAVALSGDGRVLAAAYANEIVLTDAINFQTKRAVEGVHNVTALALSANGKLLAAASNDGSVKIWTAESGVVKQNFASGGEVTALQFGTEDQFLAVGRKDGNASVWSLGTGELVFEARKHSSAVNAIAFSKDGMLMATGSDDRTAIIWELASRKPRRTLKGHDLAITSIAFSPNGATLAVGSGNASVVLWEVDKGKLDRVLK